jgi:hypothetical protein
VDTEKKSLEDIENKIVDTEKKSLEDIENKIVGTEKILGLDLDYSFAVDRVVMNNSVELVSIEHSLRSHL